MRTQTKPLIISSLLLLLVACANPLNTNRMPSAEEQCLVLNEKRIKPTQSRSKQKKVSSRIVNVESFPQFKYPARNPGETTQPEPFWAETLQASISTSAPLQLAPESGGSTLAYPGSKVNSAISYDQTSSDKQSREIKNEVTPTLTVTERSNKSEKSFLENNSVPIMMGASGLFSLLMFSLTQSRAKKFSYWAAENPWKARGIIAGIHVTTCLSALALGHHLYGQEIYISEAVNYTALSVFTTSCLLYPTKNPSFSFTHSYFAQKANDIALFTSGAVMVLCAGNHYHITQQPVTSEVVFSLSSANTFEKNIHLVKNKKDFKKEKGELRQETKKELSIGAKVALTLLVSMALFVASYGILSLSCSLACAGNEGLAVIVAVGGGALMLLLSILAFRGIFGRKRKSKKVMEATEA